MNHITFNFILAVVFIISITKCSSLNELWQIPTQQTVEEALTKCSLNNDMFATFLYNTDQNCTEIESENISCIFSLLDLWHDDRGFDGKRLAKWFHKSKMSTEIVTVVNYCNLNTLQHLYFNTWACEAYHCFTSGQLGTWIKLYVDNLYKLKKKL